MATVGYTTEDLVCNLRLMKAVAFLYRTAQRLLRSKRLDDRVGAVCIFALKMVSISQSEDRDDGILSPDCLACLQEITSVLSPFFFLEMAQTSEISAVQEAGIIALLLAVQYRVVSVATLLSLQPEVVRCFIRNTNGALGEKWRLLLRLCWVPPPAAEGWAPTPLAESVLTCFQQLSSIPPSSSLKTTAIVRPHDVLQAVADSIAESSATCPVELSAAAAQALRTLCIQCLHGAASENLRDDALRALSVLLDTRCVRPHWTTLSSFGSGDHAETFPVLLLSVVVGELRLVGEEIACFVAALAPLRSSDVSPEQREREEARLCRDSHVLSQCCLLLRWVYHLLLGADGDEADDAQALDGGGLWQQCTSSILLKLRGLLLEALKLLSDLLCQLAAPDSLPAFLRHRLPLLLHTYTDSAEDAEVRASEDEVAHAMRLLLTIFSAVKSAVRDGLTRLVLEDSSARAPLAESRVDGQSPSLTVWQAALSLSSLALLPPACPVDAFGRFVTGEANDAAARRTADPSREKLSAEELLEAREVFEQLRMVFVQEDGCYDTLYLLAAVLQDLVCGVDGDADADDVATNSDDDEDEGGSKSDEEEDDERQLRCKEKLPALPKPDVPTRTSRRLGSAAVTIAEQVLAPLLRTLQRMVPMFVGQIQAQFEEDEDGEEDAAQARQVMSDAVYLALRCVRLCLRQCLPMLKRLAKAVTPDGRQQVSSITTAFAALFQWSLPQSDSTAKALRIEAPDAQELVEDVLPSALMTIIAVLRRQMQWRRATKASTATSASEDHVVQVILREVQLVQRMLMRVEEQGLAASARTTK